MKKTVVLLLIATMLAFCLPAFSACTPREEILRICNWEDYIAPEVIDLFEAYYLETTGQKIKVQYEATETNEQMLNSIAVGQADYDIVCPSDYMIEKMIRENLLLKIDKNLGNDINGQPIANYLDSTSAFTKSRDYDPTNEYAVGYMWGTLGILYDTTVITDPSAVSSWSALWNSAYDGNIWMKDSVRDSFAAAAIYANRAELEAAALTYTSTEYNALLTEIINDTSIGGINAAKSALISQKGILKGYEVDTGKQEMIDGLAALSLQWAGDAVYSISENSDLAYVIPEEGSNVFFDGWVIPKYAVNKDAAELFMNFICSPEIAIMNMDYIGYTSAVSAPEIIDYLNENYVDFDVMDLSYFFGSAGASVHADPNMYPDAVTIERLAVMRDFNTAESSLIAMWNEVKAS